MSQREGDDCDCDCDGEGEGEGEGEVEVKSVHQNTTFKKGKWEVMVREYKSILNAHAQKWEREEEVLGLHVDGKAEDAPCRPASRCHLRSAA